MGNEEDASILGSVSIESRKPCLSETGCQNYQSGLVSRCSGLLQRSERRSLHSCRCDQCLWGFWFHVRGFDNRSLDRSPNAVVRYPFCS
jgi:hypothetical protein